MTELTLVHDVVEEAAGRACFTCSFQAEDMVVLHLLQKANPAIPVLFLETGYHFPDLLAYRDRMVESWGINLKSIASHISREQQELRFGQLVSQRSSRVLSDTESGAAVSAARNLFCLVHRIAARAVADTCQSPVGRDHDAAFGSHASQGEPAGPLALERSVELSEGE